MPRRPSKVPDAHGAAAPPAAALRQLGCGGRVVRPLGGNANMHWLVTETRPVGQVGQADPAGQVNHGDAGVAVLRRYGPWHTVDDVLYELRVLERVAARGWAVPRALTAPTLVGRHLWCLFSYVRGRPRQPRTDASRREDQRRRGRLLAALHADLATLTDLGQRPAWQRRDDVLGPRTDGPSVEEVITARVVQDEAAIMLDYADRARARFAALRAEQLPVLVTHGDLIGGNVLYSKGTLSGIIDFDFTHLDHRAADFAWTWRGKNDDFVYGYEEVTPLTAADRALLAPAYWASVLDSARIELLWGDPGNQPERRGQVSLPGVVEYLRRRSALTLE
jgi:Ser/Thr protein kinase RdoA (MazF antagonist)